MWHCSLKVDGVLFEKVQLRVYVPLLQPLLYDGCSGQFSKKSKADWPITLAGSYSSPEASILPVTMVTFNKNKSLSQG